MKTQILVLTLLLVLSINAQSQLNVQLVEGEQYVSINLIPIEDYWDEDEDRGPNVPLMFEQIVDVLNMVVDGDGYFYVPEWGYNSIEFWSLTEGYIVDVSADVEISWEGELIPPDSDIPLVPGSNLIAYFPEYALDASAPDYYVLSPMIEHVLIAKDSWGNFMLPEWEFSNMEPWETGKGYFVNVDSDDELVFNYPEEREFDPVDLIYGNHWESRAQTCYNMSVLVHSIEGIEPRGGDQIAAFGPDGQFAGAGDVRDGRCGIAVKNLEEGERFEFRYWSGRYWNEFPLEHEYLAGSRSFIVNGLMIVEATVEAELDEPSELNIVLAEGYNYVSINRSLIDEYWEEDEARGPDIPLMFEQIEENLFIVKDRRGRFYVPSHHFNSIDFWNIMEYYEVIVTADVEVAWEGILIPADTEIPISDSRNIIPYFPDYELDATAPDFYVLSPMIENVVYARDRMGDFMVPEYEFSNMDPWVPGYGYYVRIETDEDFTFSYPEEREFEPVERVYGDHWELRGVTWDNMSVLVTSIDGVEPGEGDQIAAFGSEDQLAGVGEVWDGMCGIAVRELGREESFTLRYWSESNQIEALIATDLDEGEMVYRGVLLVLNASIDLDAPRIPNLALTFELHEPYPNPFNSMTTISYCLPYPGFVSLQVYNLSGQRITTLFEGCKQSGIHTTTLTANNLPSGLYFVRLKASDQVFTQKIMLIR
ncbi:T9SS type A sorting domain-containing protein [bacterium]|nr:T9SS type A sorting domain-containing protein [bacterium]